jgi:hypothetical protein
LRYYTTGQISENISETPEGYLVCYAVPIARLGDMSYSAGETGTGKALTVRNTASVLFDPATTASFEGKPVTVQHPAPNKDPSIPDVTPDNWKQLAVGVAGAVRMGSGDDADKLISDLLITDADAIALVKNGLREISCGYECDISEPDENGITLRTRIIGNHIALVDSGRAGSDVAIRDSQPTTVEIMKEKLKAWLPTFLRVIDEMPEEVEEAVEAAVDEDPMKKIMDRLDAMEAKLADMCKPADAVEIEVETPEEEIAEEVEAVAAMADKCADSAVISLAEIIAPGIENTADIKVKALQQAMKTTDGKAAIVSLIGDKELNVENADVVDIVFNGVAKVLTEARKSALVRVVDSAPTMAAQMVTPEELNIKYAQHWAKR